MLGNLKWACRASCALRLHLFLLCLHVVVEARLAEHGPAILNRVERNRAAKVALEVLELIAMHLAQFFAVPERLLRAGLAQEVLRFFSLAHRPIEVILAAAVHSLALVAVVHRHLLQHELERLAKVLASLLNDGTILIVALSCAYCQDLLLVISFLCSFLIDYIYQFLRCLLLVEFEIFLTRRTL